MTAVLGTPVSRVDGPEKVTGAARYSAEISLPQVSYAVIAGASVPSGRIISIDADRARDAPGVLAILTHENTPKVAAPPKLVPSLAGQPAPGASFFPMQDEIIHYRGQPVSVVVADSPERAQYAASLLDVRYAEEPSLTTIDEGRSAAYEATTLFGGLMPGRIEFGDVDGALAAAAVGVEVTFRFAANHHNSIEPSATTAVWDGDRLTLYDSTMGVRAVQLTVAQLLGLPLSHVRVISNFVGGAFGGKAMVWPHVTLAAMAARQVGRPVKLVLSRPQTYFSHGHREEQEQTVALGADANGKLVAIRHEKLSIASPFDDWAEPATGISSQVYGCPNFSGVHRLIKGNTLTPTFMRGPGETASAVALETAMDELAYAMNVDPVELRLRNHSPTDPKGNPWSSDGLVECLELGVQSFHWSQRDPQPRSTRDGRWLLGTGMAVAAYPIAFLMPEQHARARIYSDGSVVVQTSTQEFGTGITTAMSQVAADALGVPLTSVRFEYGDTEFPNTGSAVGSSGAMMVGAAVHDAASALRRRLIEMAVADQKSPLHGADPSAVRAQAGRIEGPGGASDGYADLLRRSRHLDVEALGSWSPPPMDTPHGLLTFGAQFAEVAVDPDFGLVRVRRMLGVFAPGRVLNPKLARSQLMGGMLWGLGQALLEGARMEPRLGRWTAGNLGEYLVPVNADVPDVQVEFVEVTDTVVGPPGAKGIGEIGQVGAAAAIANAVFHATGRRIRQLPMAPELVMDPATTH